MGLRNYFRNKPAETTGPAGPTDGGAASSFGGNNAQLPGPIIPPPAVIPYGTSSPTVPHTPMSSGLQSSRSSGYIDDIKHEVMVNWLYQQLTAKLWINTDGDVSRPNSYFGSFASVEEGVLLKKSRDNYMACPPAVGRGVFAQAAAALNVQVSRHYLSARLRHRFSGIYADSETSTRPQQLSIRASSRPSSNGLQIPSTFHLIMGSVSKFSRRWQISFELGNTSLQHS